MLHRVATAGVARSSGRLDDERHRDRTSPT